MYLVLDVTILEGGGAGVIKFVDKKNLTRRSQIVLQLWIPPNTKWAV